MCGIAGIWEFNGAVDKGVLESMRDTLAHRGPDDEGIVLCHNGRVGLAHRRLTILDLTQAGHQPMAFEDVWTVHNGEIYNFHHLRKQLADKGHTFSSQTDTEVILKGYKAWGLDAVRRFRGMFATALWDASQRTLHLVRDRAGVKPLYYYKDTDRFIFASELRAILQHPGVRRDVNDGALALYLKLGYIPAPHSIFRNVFKLEAGHILTVDNNGRMNDSVYWNVFDCFRSGKHAEMSDEEAAEELEHILVDSFRLRTVSDVPVGVFLSGGIDSATVAALLQQHTTSPVRTFTIGFSDDAYNEAKAAKRIASHLGTDHHELYLDSRTAMDIIPLLPDIYDEPFGDTSGIPTYLVSRFARDHVKVALSADGGDELFAGYRMHETLLRSYRMLSRTGPLRKMAIGLAGMFPVRAMLEKRTGNMDLRLKKLRSALDPGFSKTSLFWAGRSLWTDGEIEELLGRSSAAPAEFTTPYHAFERDAGDFLDFVRAADYRSYLADDLLVKVDRASMAVGLEARDPFLDHTVAEFAGRLPGDLLFRDGVSKYLLKRVLHRYVPREMMDRPKQGFAVPLDTWLKTDLKHLLTDYLDENRIRKEGVFDWPTIKNEMDAFLGGRIKSSARLWLLLEYEMWRDRWMDGPVRRGNG